MIWILEVDLPYEFYFENYEELPYIQRILHLISDELCVQYIGKEGEEHVAVIYIEEELKR